MRICAISDSHCLHREIKLPKDIDLLIHAGDITNIGEIGVLADFNDWLGEQKIPYCVVVAGNHDKCFDKKPIISRKLLTNAIYLENTGVEVMGLKIWGSPLTSTLPSWSFVETDEAKRFEFWKQIPENLDILVTHGPPRGVLDQVPREYVGDGDYMIENCGDGMLLAEITRKKIPIHIFGHIHENGGKMVKGEYTTFYNVSQCDPMYNITNKPQIINL